MQNHLKLLTALLLYRTGCGGFALTGYQIVYFTVNHDVSSCCIMSNIGMIPQKD